MSKKIIWLALLLLVSLSVADKNIFVRIVTAQVSIYAEPTSSAEIITETDPGAVFEVVSFDRDWCRIKMFSTQPRFVKLSQIATTNYQLRKIAEPERRLYFKDLLKVELEAGYQAEHNYPQDYAKSLWFKQVLQDRGKYQIIRGGHYNIPDINGIEKEGWEKRWN